MKRLPGVIFFFGFLFFAVAPTSVAAIATFGPHLSTVTDTGMLAGVRAKHDAAGITDWIPITVLLHAHASGEEVAYLLDSAKRYKLFPILRIFNDGKQLKQTDVDAIVSAFSDSRVTTAGFPAKPILVFGNEVNNGEVEWGGAAANPAEYADALSSFLTKIHANLFGFRVANAPMNGSLPSRPPLLFDAIDFWNNGPKRLIEELDVLAFNAYHLQDGGAPRLTIDGWRWEWEQLDSPDKPIILTEFGYWPDATRQEREDYVSREYRAFLQGERSSLERIEAITPLLWLNGPIRVPIFSAQGDITWYDPEQIRIAADVPPPTQPAPTTNPVVDFIQQLVGGITSQNVDETIEKVNRASLPYGVIPNDENIRGVGTIQGQEGTVLGAGEDQETLAATAGHYSIALSRETPVKESAQVVSIWKSLLDKILEILGIGNKKATDFANADLPKGADGVSMRQQRTIAKQSNTLGIFDSLSAMAQSLPFRQCANLPLSLCTNNQLAGVPEIPTLPPQPSISPRPFPSDFPFPTISLPPDCQDGLCPLGYDYCSVENLSKPQYFGNRQAAEIASRICHRESTSNPLSINRGCLKSDPAKRTQEYSVGLFQINLWFDSRCHGALQNKQTEPVFSCEEGPRFDECTQEFQDPDRNIRFAVQLSSHGTDWHHWSTYNSGGCTIGSGEECEDQVPSPLTCPPIDTAIHVPGTDFKHLDESLGCIKPEMIVIHWSASWTDVDATFNTLNRRQLSCQLATDQDWQLQMLNFFPDVVQKGRCVGGQNTSGRWYNDYALNNEITGVYFNEVIDTPNHPRYEELRKETDKAIASTCWMMRQYDIPATQIFSHFELTPGKIDAGEQYFYDYFLPRVQRECGS